MQVAPLTKIIFLAGFLAAGFLLIILSCALWNNWYPLYVGKYNHRKQAIKIIITNASQKWVFSLLLQYLMPYSVAQSLMIS